jgi:hypothetical protein
VTVGPRLRRLERRLGIGRQVHDDDDLHDVIPIAEWIERERDLRHLIEEMAQGYEPWRQAYERLLPDFEAAEAEAARIGPGGVYRRRRLSDAAEAQLDRMIEKLREDGEYDRRRAELRSRREPWPVPFRSQLEPEGRSDTARGDNLSP